MAEAEAEAVQSLEELTANLGEYRAQHGQVQQLLELEPENEEYREMLDNLQEVIDLTAELIRDQQESGVEAAPAPAPAAKRSRFGPAVAETAAAVAAAATAAAMPPAPVVATGAASATAAVAGLPISTAGLPSVVAEQIKAAQAKQARAALQGAAPPMWAVGHACRAVWSEDGEWYDAQVTAVTPAGGFLVQFEGYEESEEVSMACIAPPPEVEEVYKGVNAPKRRKVEEEAAPVAEIPKSLIIEQGDDEKTIQRKKKAMKKLKSERRFQEMDQAQKSRQQSWQSFQKGKGVSKKKKGFFTGRKKESMFKSPDSLDGKVGVVGSGNRMTEFHNRGRHEFAADDE
eukprot:jgi/Tetstr1/448125/TSEL_035419.t1